VIENENQPLALVRVGGGVTGMVLPIKGPAFSVGREVGNSLCVADDPEVSRVHCVIHEMGSSLMVEDCSRNGTFLDGERVAGIRPLPVPSTVTVGQTTLAILPYLAVSATTTSAMRVPLSVQIDADSLQTGSIQIRTDAMLVVDVIDSTRLVQVDGPHFAKLVLVLGRTLEHSLQGEKQSLLKCTGDGFLACYGTASAALSAATRLAPTMKGQTRIDAQLSIALHWGIAHLTDQGDRIGNNMHAVFGLEKLRHSVPALMSAPETTQSGALILMTEAFRSQLDEAHKGHTAIVGIYPLKGLDQAVPVYRWVGAAA
jgi:class 3 adenylate cyclase